MPQFRINPETKKMEVIGENVNKKEDPFNALIKEKAKEASEQIKKDNDNKISQVKVEQTPTPQPQQQQNVQPQQNNQAMMSEEFAQWQAEQKRRAEIYAQQQAQMQQAQAQYPQPTPQNTITPEQFAQYQRQKQQELEQQQAIEYERQLQELQKAEAERQQQEYLASLPKNIIINLVDASKIQINLDGVNIEDLVSRLNDAIIQNSVFNIDQYTINTANITYYQLE